MTNPIRQTLSAEGTVNADGQFEILAITAGSGNGWNFSTECLHSSLPLWDQVQTFVDHSWSGHSIRDLAGVCFNPRWDDANQGILLTIKPVGPSAALLAEIGKEMLAEKSPSAERRPEPVEGLVEAAAQTDSQNKPRVGFSADILFTSQGKKVDTILKVFSVDLVIDPARGGKFLRALYARQPQKSLGGLFMNDEIQKQEVNTLETQLQGDKTAVQAMHLMQTQNQTLAEEAEKARQVRLVMCEQLLQSTLSVAKLPTPVSDRIRKQFTGLIFEPADLTHAVDDARQMVSELTGAQVVQGPGRIHAMYDSRDQITAAIHDLLGAERPEEIKQVKPAPLSGIRELYTLMTGDYSFTGGYHADRALLAETTDLPGILKNALNKIILTQWQELGRSGYRWWESIVSVQHFNSLQSITGVLMGELSTLPTISEGSPYTELNVSDSAETASWNKYGGYVGLTLEMFERDETHKLAQYPRKLATASLRRISDLVAGVFTANSGIGPVMADTYNVFEAPHHGNLGTTTLSSSAFEAASKAIYSQNMVASGSEGNPKMAVDARYLIVPRDLRLTAMQILYPDWERQANIFSQNMQKGQMGDVITCPEFTDANDWAAVADPAVAPGIIVAERFGLTPEIFIADNELNGALFTNDQLRMKVRQWVAVFAADYRPLFKANVA